LALAGRIESARAEILELPEDRRAQAVGVVFDQAHPAADAGDDVAAGPVMELVVEFWPNHYMALYHAGAARFEEGDQLLGRRQLDGDGRGHASGYRIGLTQRSNGDFPQAVRPRADA
jgi:hypothetical protein